MQLAGQEVSSSPRAPAVASLSFGPASGAPISLEHDLGHSEVVLADPTAIIPPPGNIARSRQAATRAYAALSGPRGPVYIGLLAVLISLPALRLGLMSDDHILAWQLEHGARPWALFEVAEERVSELREAGGIAWWASPRLSVAFLRPLASLTHALDFTAWPHTPWLMSLWNVLLYGLCAFVAALLYRRTAPSPSVASLAALLFALNEAHAMSVGWISGRNTVLALLGSLTALYCHLRAREERRRGFAVLATLAVAFALLSAEAGTWTFGLLLAYALVRYRHAQARALYLSHAPRVERAYMANLARYGSSRLRAPKARRARQASAAAAPELVAPLRLRAESQKLSTDCHLSIPRTA